MFSKFQNSTCSCQAKYGDSRKAGNSIWIVNVSRRIGDGRLGGKRDGGKEDTIGHNQFGQVMILTIGKRAFDRVMLATTTSRHATNDKNICGLIWAKQHNYFIFAKNYWALSTLRLKNICKLE